MKKRSYHWSPLLTFGLAISSAYAADPQPKEAQARCTFAGKEYSQGAFFCAAKGIGLFCGDVVIMDSNDPTQNPPRKIGKSDGQWQVMPQNGYIGLQGAHICDDATSPMPQ
jgi:hypothetical protein